MPELAVLLAESTILIARSAELCTAFRRHIAGGADGVTPFALEALAGGAACLACLVDGAGLPETQIVDSLRRLRGSVTVMVGRCSRCGTSEDRLVFGLPTDLTGAVPTFQTETLSPDSN